MPVNYGRYRSAYRGGALEIDTFKVVVYIY
jgi:hypothetical protein